MTNEKKKSAPGGTQIPEQDYSTTPGSDVQWLAEILLEMIDDMDPVRAMKRPVNPNIDRALRRMIANKNSSGEDVIINVGNGYFKPDVTNEEDRLAYNAYRARELKRAKTIIETIATMDKTFYGRY